MTMQADGIQQAALSGLTEQGQKDEFFYLCAINRASLVGNAEAGLLDPVQAHTFAQAVDQVTRQGVRTDRVIRLEPQLMQIAGPEITQLHVGRSSQDMHSTYRLAMMRDDTLRVHAALTDTLNCFAQAAERYARVIVPNYTNGVAAQPNALGHYLLGISEALIRVRDRLEVFYPCVNRSSMGACVLNGTGWPLQRDPMARRLGFAGIIENAYDATQVAPVDLSVEFTQMMQSAALAVGTFIQDLMVQYAQPRPWIVLEEGEQTTYASSAMPQKRNPGLMNDTRALASSVCAGAVEMLLLAHNLTGGMQDAKNVKNRREITLQTLEMLTRLSRILRALRVMPERALEELNSDWTASQELADTLMRDYGVPFRIGHHAASAVVSWARENNITPGSLPYGVMQRIFLNVTTREWHATEFPMTPEQLREVLDPCRIVERRATRGGAQKSSVDELLARRRTADALAAQWNHTEQEKVQSALQTLESEFAHYLAPSDVF